MKDDIILDFDKLEAEVLDRNKEVLSNIQKAMLVTKSTLESLTAKGWSGEAAAAFTIQYKEYQKDTAVLCGHIVQLQNALYQIGEEGMDTVQKNSNEVENTL